MPRAGRIRPKTISFGSLTTPRTSPERTSTLRMTLVNNPKKAFRDVHSATKHITLSSSHFEMVGQYLLGGGLQVRR